MPGKVRPDNERDFLIVAVRCFKKKLRWIARFFYCVLCVCLAPFVTKHRVTKNIMGAAENAGVVQAVRYFKKEIRAKT